MNPMQTPVVFSKLFQDQCIDLADIFNTEDGFFLLNKSISGILATKGILDFPDSTGQILPCDRFFDDWYLYAVPYGDGHTYSLLKLREQEHDTEDGTPADGDIPGVTVSFIAFQYQSLLKTLADPSAENRQALNAEINRVVVRRGQRHHRALKQYFVDPKAEGPYLIANLYIRHIAALSENGVLDTPECYQATVQRSISYKSSAKFARLPKFIDALNQKAGRVVCDHEKLYFQDSTDPDLYEAAAILATHTGNTSLYSFAAEVEYHAKFLTPIAKIKIPFFGRSIYDSAIRADMTVGDNEFEGPALFHRPDSKIVKRQYQLHQNPQYL